MKIYNADFLRGAAKPENFPDTKLPEIAFAGRSNVGKSSLLNSIVHRKNLAHTSSTPGKTQQINFFVIEDIWIFADMPGLGYAAKGKQFRDEWKKLNFHYLETRNQLNLVCMLVDSRHDPMDTDLGLIEMLENFRKNYLIVLTKCDKIKPKDIEERKKQLEMLVSQCKFAAEVLPYSSVSGMGRQELLAVIKKYTI